jgi:hypothetical protein
MTENERTILVALSDLNDIAARRGVPDLHHPASAVGGVSNSHHAVTLSRMVEKGWVARRRRFDSRPRSAWGYRITLAGAQALTNAGLTRRIGEAAR